MPPLLTRRIEIPAAWLAAFMFGFKLISVLLAIVMLIWYLALPSNGASAPTGPDALRPFSANDFAATALGLSGLYFLAAGVLVVGGLIQGFEYSRRAGLRSIAFGVFALIAGIVLVCVSEPSGQLETFRFVT